LPGVVKKVNVKPGDTVQANDTVIVIEAMKMETNISSPVGGTIKEIKVSLEQSVQQGEVLATFE
jgi:pyruvate carboxylase